MWHARELTITALSVSLDAHIQDIEKYAKRLRTSEEPL
jgi:hypothetical protein